MYVESDAPVIQVVDVAKEEKATSTDNACSILITDFLNLKKLCVENF